MTVNEKLYNRPEPPKPPEGISAAELALWYENMGQLFLAEAMKLKGVIKVDKEPAIIVFAIRCAPIIRMVLDGDIEWQESRWDRARDEVKKLTKEST